MTAINWKTGSNGMGLTGGFDTAADWSTGAVPTSADDVTIAAPGSYTVTISSGTDGVHSLTLNAAGATLLDMSPQFFTVSSALTISAGTLELVNSTEVVSGNNTGVFKLSAGGTLLAGHGGGSLQFGTITTAGLINTGADGLDFNTSAGSAGNTIGGTLSGTGGLLLGVGGSYALAAAGLAGASKLTIGQTALSVSASSTLASQLQGYSGTLAIGHGANLTATGAVSLSTDLNAQTAFLLSGPGTFTTKAASAVGDLRSMGQSVELTGGVTWANSGTVTDGGIIAYNDPGVSADAATIVNAAAGVFSIIGSDAGLILNGTGMDLFTNAGTLTRGGDSNASTLAATLVSTGTIDVIAGELDLSGGGTISGTLSGAGTLSLDSGSYTIGSLVGGGTIRGNGATVTYTGSTINTAYTLDDNMTLAVASGKTLTLAGQFTIGDATGGGTITGPGTLVTSAATTIADLGSLAPVLDLDGGLVWRNSGTVSDAGYGYLDAYGGGSPASIVNTGSFDFVGDDSALVLDTQGGGSPAGTFTNTGTLAKTTGTASSTLGGTIIDSGTVNVASGTLSLTGNGSLGGTLSGAGTLALTAGSFTIAALSGAGTLAVNAATLTGTGLAISAVTASVHVANGGTLSAATGKILTLSGPVSIGDATGGSVVFAGPGTLATSGTTTINDLGTGNVALSVAGAWANSGTVNDAGYGFFDVYGGGSPGSIVNSGTFNFVGDDSGLVLDQQGGGSPAGTFTNTGTLAKTSGTGTSTIGGRVLDTGTASILSGTLALLGGGSATGTLTGSGVLDLGGGAFTTAGLAGTGTLAVTSGATLSGSATSAITASVHVASGGTLSAATGKILTLSGPVSIGDATGGSVVFAGPGTLATSGTTTINDLGTGNVALSVAGAWANSGTVNDAGYGFFDVYGGGSPGSIVNSGSFNFVGDDSGLVLDQQGGGSPAGTFTNTGTLAKTSGIGTNTIGGRVLDTGTVSILSGTLALLGGGSATGTLTGSGVLDLGGGAFTTGGLAGAGNLAVTGGASLMSTVTSTITASVHAASGGTLSAATGKILTLSGPVSIGDATGGSVVFTGPGTLATSGTTTINDTGAGNVALSVAGAWANSGTVNDAGYGFFDVYGGGSPGSIVNSGTFNFVGDDSGLVLDQQGGGSPAGTFTNTGTLAKTSGIGTNTIGGRVLDTGTVSILSGTLALLGGGSATGTLTGSGVLDLGGGAFTTGGLAGAGNLAVTGGASLMSTVTSTITASVHAASGGTLSAATGKILTLSGPVSIGDATGGSVVFTGPGTLATSGTTTINDTGAGNVALSVAGAWANSGTVNDAGYGFFDVYGGGSPGSIVNSGTFNFVGDDSGLVLDQQGGGSPAGTFTNTGTLAKTAGTGTSTIGVGISNTGTIEAAHGTLSLAGPVTGAGNLKIDAGATLDVGTTPASQKIAFTGGAGATLKLETPASIGTLTNFTAGDRLDLVGASVSSAKITGTTLSVVTASGTDTYVSAGLAGEVATTASDGAGGTFVSLYRGAIATHTPEPLAFGNVHVGSTTGTTAALTITNSALADGYSETLNAGFGGASTGFSAGGTVSGIAAGASNSNSLTATIDTSTAGAKTGTATLTLASNGAGVDGRGVTALPNQTVTLTGGVYAYAIGSVASSTVNLGHQHVGAASALITVSNIAATGGFSEALDAMFTAATGSATGTGTASLIAAGAGNTTSLSVGLSPAAGGVATGSETLTYVSDGTGTSGLGTTTLGTQAISVTGTFYNDALGKLASTTLAFGNHHVGDRVAAKTLTVINGAPTGGFSEKLDAGVTGTGELKGAGTVTALAAGTSNNSSLTIGETASVAGTIGGTAVVGLVSDGAGTSGLGTTVLASQTITVTGANYNLATGVAANGGTISLGVIHAGTAAPGALGVTDGAAAGAYSESLDAGLATAAAGLSVAGTVTGLLAGATDSTHLQVSVTTAATGAYTGTATLGLVSDGAGTSGLGTTALASQTVTVTATVDNYAVAAFEDPSGPAITGTSTNETINLGSALQGSNALSLTLGVLNAATGLSDLLGGTLTSAGGAGFTDSGLGMFSGLSAGQDEHAQSVVLSTGTTGIFTETVVLASAGSNASGYSGALANETLTITGTITPSVFTTYTLALGPNVITGANGRGDIFVAAAGALNSRDQLTGGTGANSVTLNGAGLFDINAPAAFSNIPTINAHEGQASNGTLADTRQTVLLRDGVGETLVVAAGKAANGNANAEAITIYGGNGADVITLAAGADSIFLGTGAETVTLGGAANKVTGGGGTALVHAAAANAAAAVVGTSTGATTLDIMTGGAIRLNAADTYLTVKLEAASTLTLSAMSFITATGSGGADTITAMAGNQILTGGAGVDTLTGYTGGGDSFIDTASGLNGDTIGNWTTNDMIDLTDIVAANLHALTFSSGTLGVTDGTASAAINFTGNVALSNFSVIGSDGHGGTLLGFHG